MAAYQSISVADANGDNEDDQEVGHTHHNNSSQRNILPQTRHQPRLFYLAIAIALLITIDWARLRFTSSVDNIDIIKVVNHLPPLPTGVNLARGG